MTTPAIQLDLSLGTLGADNNDNGSCSSKDDLFSHQSGFGSPIAVPALSGFQHHLQGVYPVFRSAESSILGKQPGVAQLTIFYGGMVNVYDDIPADKAQAIMLLASSGKAVQNKSSYASHEPHLTKSADLPIARKHSLQLFLEKRKNRLNAKAPYANTEQKPKPKSGPESYI